MLRTPTVVADRSHSDAAWRYDRVRAVFVRLTLVAQSLLELDELLSLDEQLELSLELL